MGIIIHHSYVVYQLTAIYWAFIKSMLGSKMSVKVGVKIHIIRSFVHPLVHPWEFSTRGFSTKIF